MNEGGCLKILVTKTGGVEMLHDDVAELESLGKISTTRASHVEYDNDKQKWFVQSAFTLKVLGYFVTRSEALDWEKEYYSPSGEGWSELHDGGSK
jgi:hypothetical protein